MTRCGRPPAGQQIQAASQRLRRQELTAGAKRHVVPETVDILRRSPGKGSGAVEFQPPTAAGAIASPKQERLLLEGIFINLTRNAGSDFALEQQPVGLALAVIQPRPERLADAQEQVQCGVMFVVRVASVPFGPGGNGNLKPVIRLGPLRNQAPASQFLDNRDLAWPQLTCQGRRNRPHSRPDEPGNQGRRNPRSGGHSPAVSEPQAGASALRHLSRFGSGGSPQAFAPLPADLIAGMAFLASSSVSKPITAANFRPITCAMKKAILMPAAAIACAIR